MYLWLLSFSMTVNTLSLGDRKPRPDAPLILTSFKIRGVHTGDPNSRRQDAKSPVVFYPPPPPHHHQHNHHHNGDTTWCAFSVIELLRLTMSSRPSTSAGASVAAEGTVNECLIARGVLTISIQRISFTEKHPFGTGLLLNTVIKLKN